MHWAKSVVLLMVAGFSLIVFARLQDEPSTDPNRLDPAKIQAALDLRYKDFYAAVNSADSDASEEVLTRQFVFYDSQDPKTMEVPIAKSQYLQQIESGTPYGATLMLLGGDEDDLGDSNIKLTRKIAALVPGRMVASALFTETVSFSFMDESGIFGEKKKTVKLDIVNKLSDQWERTTGEFSGDINWRLRAREFVSTETLVNGKPIDLSKLEPPSDPGLRKFTMEASRLQSTRR